LYKDSLVDITPEEFAEYLRRDLGGKAPNKELLRPSPAPKYCIIFLIYFWKECDFDKS